MANCLPTVHKREGSGLHLSLRRSAALNTTSKLENPGIQLRALLINIQNSGFCVLLVLVVIGGGVKIPKPLSIVIPLLGTKYISNSNLNLEVDPSFCQANLQAHRPQGPSRTPMRYMEMILIQKKADPNRYQPSALPIACLGYVGVEHSILD